MRPFCQICNWSIKKRGFGYFLKLSQFSHVFCRYFSVFVCNTYFENVRLLQSRLLTVKRSIKMLVHTTNLKINITLSLHGVHLEADVMHQRQYTKCIHLLLVWRTSSFLSTLTLPLLPPLPSCKNIDLSTCQANTSEQCARGALFLW